jgi:hypothetical protein
MPNSMGFFSMPPDLGFINKLQPQPVGVYLPKGAQIEVAVSEAEF